MRLWHEDLIKKLPRMQLQGMIREIPAMRGKGWGKKHSTVDYVFEHDMEKLVAFHQLVIKEFKKRCHNSDPIWEEYTYRGKRADRNYDIVPLRVDQYLMQSENIYPEHNDQYLEECINNLMEKGVVCKFFKKFLDREIVS